MAASKFGADVIAAFFLVEDADVGFAPFPFAGDDFAAVVDGAFVMAG